MKKLLRTLLVLLILIGTLGAFYIHATLISPQSINVRKEKISSEKIPTQLDGLKIVFFSDVHFNQYVDEERLLKVISAINNQKPDVVLFGGDLFDHPANQIPDDTKQNQMVEALKSIEAPLGKFAVLGNHDLEAESSKEMISSVLYRGEFEIITNRSLRIRKNSSVSIVLVGLDSQMLGSPNVDAAFANVQSTDFVITICHTPDTVLDSPTNLIDLFLAGHGHGGQVYIPFFGALYKANYAEQYYRGKHQIEQTLLDVTNGTGTTKMDIRFLAEPEIVVYTLNSKAK